MELDNRTKKLLRQLGRAINEAVSESDEIAHTIARIKANGLDVFLMLDAVVALNKSSGDSSEEPVSLQDQRFLKSLKIRIDEEAGERDGGRRLTITPQDIKFLKSLRISVDDIEYT